MKKVFMLSILLTTLAFIAGCPPPRRTPHVPRHYDFNNPLKRVAILPMKNSTMDVGGPDKLRGKMEAILRDKGYNVKPFKESDQILRDQMGINLGGQLDMTTPQKLGEVLGVEGVLYSELMDFEDTTTGVYNVKKVRAKFKLVNTATGGTFWERGLGVKSEMKMQGVIGAATSTAAKAQDAREREAPWVLLESVTNNGGFGESMGIALGSKLISKATGTHLDRESTELARRVTDNLPWGPGPNAAAVAVPAEAPEFEPEIKMPEVRIPEPPSFGYMDYGRRDFTALLVSTTVNKSSSESNTIEIPLAKAGEKIRMDMDLSRMARGREVPPSINKMSTIHRGDQKISLTLYPNMRKYITHRETEEEYRGEEPKVQKTWVAKEVIDRHPTDKFRVKVTYKNGRIEEGFIWIAKDLKGMTIRSEVESKEFKITTQLKNIILRTPPLSDFEIPAGYTEVASMMELMMEEHK